MKAVDWRDIHLSDPIGQPPSAYVRLRGWLLTPKVEGVLSAAGLVAVAVVGGWLAWR